MTQVFDLLTYLFTFIAVVFPVGAAVWAWVKGLES